MYLAGRQKRSVEAVIILQRRQNANPHPDLHLLPPPPPALLLQCGLGVEEKRPDQIWQQCVDVLPQNFVGPLSVRPEYSSMEKRRATVGTPLDAVSQKTAY